ncbi:uracil-DNA glycosylase [Deinococcus sp. AJ005]|uniref:uracil-DNA glycosylase n=1 Tax=Deinococcus sp. AJ005 TaxID=2652443 RepID=UPI00125CBEF0|nr:uracil-DNA glycosylase [Deinococcus sp. AJ005]QFP75115.1 uracil-DNA glycosylase [Deinococcus sp. AJ005]
MHTQSLADPSVLAARRARLQEPHIAPLTAFAARLRESKALGGRLDLPDFDPESGGIHTDILLLLESPGPKVAQTGFASPDNPDRTAENLSCLLKLAGIGRGRCLLWNILPWQLSAGGVVTPTAAQVKAATPATLELLTLLPALRVVVLVGGKAQGGWQFVSSKLSRPLPTVNCPHPSPRYFATDPQAPVRALSALVEARLLAKNTVS